MSKQTIDSKLERYASTESNLEAAIGEFVSDFTAEPDLVPVQWQKVNANQKVILTGAYFVARGQRNAAFYASSEMRQIIVSGFNRIDWNAKDAGLALTNLGAILDSEFDAAQTLAFRYGKMTDKQTERLEKMLPDLEFAAAQHLTPLSKDRLRVVIAKLQGILETEVSTPEKELIAK